MLYASKVSRKRKCRFYWLVELLYFLTSLISYLMVFVESFEIPCLNRPFYLLLFVVTKRCYMFPILTLNRSPTSFYRSAQLH
jgi:hypothetical protein